MTAPTFTGFPADAFEFYDELAANNARPWWQDNKDRYLRAVRGPLEALITELGPEFGAGHLYRPYRDTRFSKDKTPLKDHQGALIGVEDSVGYYVQISAQGLMVGGGWYAPQGHQVRRFREAIEAGHAAHVRAMVTEVTEKGWAVEGNPLRTRPRGVDPDHPDLDLLRLRSLVAVRTAAPEAWMGTRAALDWVRDAWREAGPLVDWLGDHVGPAADPALPPE